MLITVLRSDIYKLLILSNQQCRTQINSIIINDTTGVHPLHLRSCNHLMFDILSSEND